MAEAIKDGVFGFVSGTVGRSFTHKNGTAFEVLVQSPKSQYPDKWTVWADLPVTEGDRVTVKGFLSASAETFEKDGVTKAASRRSVNSPHLEAHEASAPVESDEPWSTPGSFGDDDSSVPF